MALTAPHEKVVDNNKQLLAMCSVPCGLRVNGFWHQAGERFVVMGQAGDGERFVVIHIGKIVEPRDKTMCNHKIFIPT